jgi:outer membrane protein
MILIKRVWTALALAAVTLTANAQTKQLSLDEAVQLGIQNSKQLKLSQNKIDQATSQFKQTQDAVKPTIKVSAGYSHALMLSRKFAFPSSDGSAAKTTEFPFDNGLSQATISVNEPIIAGHRFKYAQQSATLLIQSAKLDAEKDKDEIVHTIILAYINYYKIVQNQKIIEQNLGDVQQKLDEIKKFENQGLATRNDVLRFELQRSNIQLSQIELENNRKVVNYNLDIMLGLPDNTTIQVQDVAYKLDALNGSDVFVKQALQDRKEFGSLKYQDQLTDISYKKLRDEKLPTVGVGGNLYYFNLSKNIFPTSGQYLAPLVIGVTASWDVTTLFKSKNKLEEVKLQKQEVAANRDLLTDKVKMEVNQSYIEFQQTLEKIKVLQDAVVQATENERIMESKFKNNLATTTDRIDAQSLLYEARLNLELAKADATAAYYNLQNYTGHIQP